MTEGATVPVVAAVVCRQGRCLVGRRPAHKRHGGLWEFPGGKLEPGESDLDGARRELSEELGLAARSLGRLLFTATDPGSPFRIRFVEVEVDGDPVPVEHSQVRWATPAELEGMPLAPTDARFVRECLAPGGSPRPLAEPRAAQDHLDESAERMTDTTEQDLRYPVGPLRWEPTLTPEERARCIDTLETLPRQLRDVVGGMTHEQLDTPYRPGGWTVRQVVHHLPDSHVNSYVRFKLGATEDEPTINTYEQDRWAEQSDARGPIEVSLRLLEALHERWVAWLRALDADTWRRAFVHPELGRITLEQNLQVYCWHCRHHLAHITGLVERKGWAP